MLDRFIRRCFSEEYRKPEMSVFAMGCSPHGKGWEHFSMGVEVPDETNWRPVRTPVKTFEHIPHDGFYDDQHFSKPVTPPRSKNRQRNDLVARTAPLAATHRHGGAGNHGGEEPGFRYGRRRIQTPTFVLKSGQAKSGQPKWPEQGLNRRSDHIPNSGCAARRGMCRSTSKRAIQPEQYLT